MATNPEKLYKKVLTDQERRLKPGECQKYVRLVLDSTLSSSNFGRELLAVLETKNLNQIVRNGIGENCICWERNVGQREFTCDDDLAVCNDEWMAVNQVFKIMKAMELKLHVQQNTLSKVVKEFQASFSDKRLTVVVPRIKNKDKDSNIPNELAKVYVELQLLEEVAIIEVMPNAIELCALLCRFTKAIAEAPYKQQKSEKLNGFKKYLANDKKQCVRVVGTVGFGRLWQQHLNRLPLVTLEVAEAIIAGYSCPRKLLHAYRHNPYVIDEVGNLRLKRVNGPQNGPLQTERRIGNVLSTKLHTLYNSRDPNECI